MLLLKTNVTTAKHSNNFFGDSELFVLCTYIERKIKHTIKIKMASIKHWL